ncbi:MAG: hypothetical protein A3C90_02750 [Candidatus Magasanikbacteria bacterium RIFCSPHIGHO2_02_FULL_51_14]|uniref:Uncharacterized protein n=1 Tax=Candidatus Magasanikbacteria bacterium RIFCSPHIGHO2_02_FULL_51_14 TaxID=1798683 RepID=A0A1F6MQL2_9BACT|nr:MAG: hypothetical protein A3C90_02750 [Candidatus Magasanikbacteria bacterium RIFCSPHIGHO2_02_FULL_51_14]
MTARLSIISLLFVVIALPALVFFGMTDMSMEHHACPISLLLNGACVGDDAAALVMAAQHLSAWRSATWAAMAGVVAGFALSLLFWFLSRRILWKPPDGRAERSPWQTMRRRLDETASLAFQKLHHWLALHNKQGEDLVHLRAHAST